MKYVEIIVENRSVNMIESIAQKAKAIDFRVGAVGEDGMRQIRVLIDDDNLQLILDTLQNVLGAQSTAHIVVLSVEASLPKPDDNVKDRNKKKDEAESVMIAREVLYEEVKKGANLDLNFILLVFLSTVVAAIGLIDNNVAVVIGAMVIAPLLGPNLALSLATTLGDIKLMKKSIQTLFVGLLLSIGLSAIFGIFWSADFTSHELMSRTNVNLSAIFLALASGAAAALSLTTGLSGVLVGVMVAVALLPPAVTLGIMLGNGNTQLAMQAGTLLAINIVCVNLSSKIVFFLKGIHPRTWLEKEAAKWAMFQYILGWIITLFILSLLIYYL